MQKKNAIKPRPFEIWLEEWKNMCRRALLLMLFFLNANPTSPLVSAITPSDGIPPSFFFLVRRPRSCVSARSAIFFFGNALRQPYFWGLSQGGGPSLGWWVGGDPPSPRGQRKPVSHVSPWKVGDPLRVVKRSLFCSRRGGLLFEFSPYMVGNCGRRRRFGQPSTRRRIFYVHCYQY